MNKLTNDGNKLEYFVFIFCAIFMLCVLYWLVTGGHG